jgi:integrating conjugative element protein (TIGR03757 family)
MMISLISLNHSVSSEVIEVFTTSMHPIALNGLRAKVCELDILNKMTDELNQNMRHIVASNQVDEIQNARITTFYRCQNQARLYELKSLPAIVIDKAYVVYGMHAVDKAVIAARNHHEVRHG